MRHSNMLVSLFYCQSKPSNALKLSETVIVKLSVDIILSRYYYNVI